VKNGVIAKVIEGFIEAGARRIGQHRHAFSPVDNAVNRTAIKNLVSNEQRVFCAVLHLHRDGKLAGIKPEGLDTIGRIRLGFDDLGRSDIAERLIHRRRVGRRLRGLSDLPVAAVPIETERRLVGLGRAADSDGVNVSGLNGESGFENTGGGFSRLGVVPIEVVINAAENDGANEDDECGFLDHFTFLVTRLVNCLSLACRERACDVLDGGVTGVSAR
jgi:hypothetical protein